MNMFELECDNCKSKDIVETHEGYVCRNCGVVLDLQRFKHSMVNDNKFTHRTGSKITYIGNKLERSTTPESYKLERLNRLNSKRDYQERVLIRAYYETIRILSILKYDSIHVKPILSMFEKIYDKLRPKTRFRSVERLVPVIIYFYAKLNIIPINELELINVSRISKKNFNSFKFQIINFIPRYAVRNRQQYILNKIFETIEFYKLGMPFYFQSKKLFYKLWERIKNTKDDVIAGLIISLNLLCIKEYILCVTKVCRKLGIQMSTIQSQVKKHIIEPRKVEEFISLVKSADLIKQSLNKMELAKT